jgi:hypothetical protein
LIACGRTSKNGYIATWGRDTLKIARLMREAGLEPPRMTGRDRVVVVAFDVAAARDTQPAAQEKNGGKTPDGVLQHLSRNPGLNIPELAILL